MAFKTIDSFFAVAMRAFMHRTLPRIKLPPYELIDHLIRAQHDRWGYGKAERLGGLEVQDDLEFCRQLNRKIARLGAAQNAIDISRGATPDVCRVGSGL